MKIAECLTKDPAHFIWRFLSSGSHTVKLLFLWKDWEEMMGKNMDTYKRVRGAVRRR